MTEPCPNCGRVGPKDMHAGSMVEFICKPSDEKIAPTFEEHRESESLGDILKAATHRRCCYEAGVQARTREYMRHVGIIQRTIAALGPLAIERDIHFDNLPEHIAALQSTLSEKEERIKELEGALREASVLFHTRRGMCIYPGTEGDMYSVQGAHAELCQRTDDLLKD